MPSNSGCLAEQGDKKKRQLILGPYKCAYLWHQVHSHAVTGGGGGGAGGGGLGMLNSRLGPTPSFACASLLAQVWCPT